MKTLAMVLAMIATLVGGYDAIMLVDANNIVLSTPS
jgi:hypothetical protein